MNEPVWPPGKEWPQGSLPQPTLTIELSAMELLALADSHLIQAANAAGKSEHDTRLFFEARARYLHQKVAAVAPHLFAPERKGTA